MTTLPTLKIQSLADAAQSVVPVTFGQVFLRGALPAGSGLSAGDVPLQVDVKNKYDDGSVRFAVLSGVLPSLAAKEARSFDLAAIGAIHPARASNWPDAFSCVVTITLAGVVYRASAAQNDVRKWLDGAAVTETQSVMVFTADDGTKHPHLTARFAIRDYHGTGKLRADVTIENAWAFEPNPQNFAYDVKIDVAGQTVYTKSLTQFRQSRWRKIFWFGDAPQVNVIPVGLDEAKVVPHYDPAFPPAENLLQSLAARSIGAFEPMWLGLASAYMPTTGANDEIGLLPMWAAAYVMSGDARARDATLGTGNAAGSYSSHYRDRKTDRPVSIVDYPYMTILGNHGDTVNPATGKSEAFPWVPPGNETPYTHDTPHQPSLAFVPYLTTGDYFYLEEMQFWASFNAFSSNPGYREHEKGLFNSDQVRGQSWCMRTLAQVAAFTPDDDALKPAFMSFLNSNIDWYANAYVKAARADYANNLGMITNGYSLVYEGGRGLAPWQDDFFTSAIGHMVDLGFTQAKPLLDWKAKSVVGRMTEPGVCWIDATVYSLLIRDSSSAPFYSTFAQCQSATRGPDFLKMICGGPEMAAVINAKVGDMGGISDGVMGYPANMQPALAYAVESGIPGAKRAWDLFTSRTVKPDYRQGGQFSIVPRDYAAAFVAPIIDTTPKDDWEQIAVEGGTAVVAAATKVRFGAGARWVTKVVSGAVPATNAFFGTDPAPNVAKVLQQFIPPAPVSKGNSMTYKLSVLSIAFAAQQLASSAEASPSSLRVEVLSGDLSTVLGQTNTVPGDIAGLSFPDLGATYVIRASGLDSTGAVMGAPATQNFVPKDYLPAVPVDPVPPADPVPATKNVSLPSSVTFSLARE